MSKRYTEPQPGSESESRSGSESESESESESVSAREKVSTRKKDYTSSETSSTSVSDDSDSVEGGEQQQPIPNSEKNGSTPLEVTEISKVQYLEGRVQQAKEKANNKFMKIFNFQDEEIILEALLKSGHKDGTSDFWTAVGQSLQLSISATQTQVYGKIRRLKENYVKRLSAENSNQVMSQDEEKLHKLCTDIWGTILKPKEEGGGCEKKPQAVLVEEPAVSDNFQKLARAIRMDDLKIRVEEAINFLPASKRPKIEQKWNDVCVSMLQLYTRGIELMQEIIREAASGE